MAQGRGPSRDFKHGVFVGSVEKMPASRKLCKTSELANCKSKGMSGPCGQLEPGIISSGLDLSSRQHSAASQTGLTFDPLILSCS